MEGVRSRATATRYGTLGTAEESLLTPPSLMCLSYKLTESFRTVKPLTGSQTRVPLPPPPPLEATSSCASCIVRSSGSPTRTGMHPLSITQSNFPGPLRRKTYQVPHWGLGLD